MKQTEIEIIYPEKAWEYHSDIIQITEKDFERWKDKFEKTIENFSLPVLQQEYSNKALTMQDKNEKYELNVSHKGTTNILAFTVYIKDERAATLKATWKIAKKIEHNNFWIDILNIIY